MRLKFLKDKKLFSRGFSYAEFIVVIAILSILFIIVFANYKQGANDYALLRSSYKLAHDIREAQEMATSAKKCPVAVCGGLGGVPPGYGIYVDRVSSPNSYKLYADNNPAAGDEYYTASDTTIKDIPFEAGTQIYSIVVDGILRDSASINFKSPDPIVKIKDAPAANASSIQLIISLSQATTAPFRQIIVNKTGMVEVR